MAHGSALPTSEYLQSTQTWHTDSYEVLTALARSGLGSATLPRQLVLPEIASGELVELRLDAYPFTDWLVSVDLIWHRGRRLGSVETWLLDRFRRHPVHEVAEDGQSTIRMC